MRVHLLESVLALCCLPQVCLSISLIRNLSFRFRFVSFLWFSLGAILFVDENHDIMDTSPRVKTTPRADVDVDTFLTYVCTSSGML